jgi:hypothetical protein
MIQTQQLIRPFSVPVPGLDTNLPGPAMGLRRDEETWALFGLPEYAPTKPHAWVHITADGLAHGPVICRSLRRHLESECRRGYWTRLQLQIPLQYGACHKLALWLGFEIEGCMRAAGPQSEDCILYGRIG